MSLGNKIAWDDTVLPFQLDAADMRGRIARLDGVLQGILKQHQYPKAVEALVAEMALLTALIGESIKLQWKLSLQVQTNGPVRMIATDFYAPKETGETAQIRAYASFDKAENWNRINYHLDTIEDLELIGPSVTPSELLVRLFHEEQPRIFDTQSVRFGCSCSEDRVRQSLSIYSAKDISQMITSDGLVTADCQFCGAHYELDPKSVGFEAISSGN